jgi:hypothetical protein
MMASRSAGGNGLTGRSPSRSAAGYRFAASTAARTWAAPAGVPAGLSNGPYGAPYAGCPGWTRQPSASAPTSTAS